MNKPSPGAMKAKDKIMTYLKNRGYDLEKHAPYVEAELVIIIDEEMVTARMSERMTVCIVSGICIKELNEGGAGLLNHTIQSQLGGYKWLRNPKLLDFSYLNTDADTHYYRMMVECDNIEKNHEGETP